MDAPELSPVQLRVVGCLLEKELATPDTYPLTMNGLLAACNQSSNRQPVVHYEEPTVSNAIENLKATGVVRVVHSRSNRADRFRQVIDELLDLDVPARAVLAVLMLRGPQTTAEVRARTERLHPFASDGAAEQVLHDLAADDRSLAVQLARQPGQKEPRWAHLLGGPLSDDDLAAAASSGPAASVGHRSDRLQALEDAVVQLQADLAQLRRDLGA